MLPADPITAPWRASLDLTFARRDDATLLVERRHSGPLRVQKPLYPEGRALCHALVLHPPAGIAGGDELALRVHAHDGAQALLTTPGAGKWYRSAGPHAAQAVSIRVDAGASIEWLPQESIVFDGALARMSTAVELAEDARYLGLEILCLGRRASGERFTRGHLALATDIRCAGVPLWHERARLDGGSPLLHSPVGLASATVCATVLAAGSDIAAATLAACRAVPLVEASAQAGVTALPKLFVGRYLGHSAAAARAWFFGLWQTLRPALIDRAAATPRIWNT
jgi:urease accessory protein